MHRHIACAYFAAYAIVLGGIVALSGYDTLAALACIVLVSGAFVTVMARSEPLSLAGAARLLLFGVLVVAVVALGVVLARASVALPRRPRTARVSY